MAKPLGEKSRIIRTAITGNPDKGNTKLADMLNDSQDRLDDKITFTADDIAKQKQAMKKPGALKVTAAAPAAAPEPESATAPELAPAPAPAQAAKLPKKKPGPKPKAAAAANSAALPAQTKTKASPVDVIDNVLILAKQCGGMGELKRLVELLTKG